MCVWSNKILDEPHTEENQTDPRVPKRLHSVRNSLSNLHALLACAIDQPLLFEKWRRHSEEIRSYLSTPGHITFGASEATFARCPESTHVASLLLVAMAWFSCSQQRTLLLVVRPGAPSSVLATSSDAPCYQQLLATLKLHAYLSGETRKVETDRVAVGAVSGEGLSPVFPERAPCSIMDESNKAREHKKAQEEHRCGQIAPHGSAERLRCVDARLCKGV